MHPARISELLAPFLGETDDQRLTAGDLSRISTYIDLLLRWNARINLTAIRDPEEIVTRHFGESLFAARYLVPNRVHVGTAAPGCPSEQGLAGRGERVGRGGRAALQVCPERSRKNRVRDENEVGTSALAVADLGSGAGFPGIPIKLWAPHVALTLIESNHKKSAFLREVTRAITLTNINIHTARAESLMGRTFDVVTLRAVERFDSILATAIRLVAPNGRLALLISSSQLDQARTTLAQSLDSAAWLNVPWSIHPFPLSASRILALLHSPRT